MSKQTYMSVTNTSSILSIVVSQSYNIPSASSEVVARTTSLDIGDAVTVRVGYTGDHNQVFTGYVKNIERSIPENTYIITVNDKMIRALDYFIASSNPNTPFTRSAIAAEDYLCSCFSGKF